MSKIIPLLIILFCFLFNLSAFGQISNENACQVKSTELNAFRNLKLGMRVKTPKEYKNASYPYYSRNGGFTLIKNAEELGWFSAEYNGGFHSVFPKVASLKEGIDTNELLRLKISALDNSLVFFLLEFEKSGKPLLINDWVKRLSKELNLPEDAWSFYDQIAEIRE